MRLKGTLSRNSIPSTQRFVWKKLEIEEVREKHPRASDRGFKGDIDNLEKLNFEFIITKDQFIEPVGPFYPYIKDLPDDVELICVDMRI